MARFVGIILSVVTIAVGIITANPALITAGVSAFVTATVALVFAPKAPTPPTTERTIRNPTPLRVYGTGTRRVFGASVLFQTNSNGVTVDVLAFLDGRANAIIRYYLNDDIVTINNGVVNRLSDGSYQDRVVRVGVNLGLATETAFTPVIQALPGIWTSDHRGDGVVSGYLLKEPVRDRDFLETYPQGDNVQLSVVLQMNLVFDFRVQAQDAYNEITWAYSDNPVLGFLRYLLVHRNYDYDTQILPQIDLWIRAANVCDEQLSLDAGGSEKRYRAWVIWDSRARPSEVIASYLETFDGWFAENERGELVVFAGEYIEPTVTINPEHILDYSHQSFVENENYVNELSIQYISALHDYNSVEAEAFRDETDIARRGIINNNSFAPQVPSFTQARRLAKAQMARINAPDRGQVTTNFAGRAVLGNRFINLNLIEAGTTLFTGTVEIISVTKNSQTGGVTFDWVAVDQNAYAWNPATEDGFGATVGNSAIQLALGTPTISSAAFLFDGTASTARIIVNGEGPDRRDLTWFLRWRVKLDSAWNEQRFDDIDPSANVELISNSVPTGEIIEVQISYATGDGRASEWSLSAEVDIDLEATPPDNATSITLQSWDNSINLITPQIARATSYRWSIFEGDGTTLIENISTATNSITYTNAMAGGNIQRDYVIAVAGVNSAGVGGFVDTGLIANDAPIAVTNLVVTGGDTSADISFTPSTSSDTVGNVIHYSDTQSFDPVTQGRFTSFGNTGSFILDNLAAGTYYYKLAPFDRWTSNPSYVNFSNEGSFVITVGGGGSGGGGGGFNSGNPDSQQNVPE